MRADGLGREKINTSRRKGTAGSKYKDLDTKDAAEDSTGAWKITGFRVYQTRASGGTLFCFLYSNLAFLEACINGE